MVFATKSFPVPVSPVINTVKLFPMSFEIDWKIFGGALPNYVDMQSERVRSGLGVIPRLAASGAEIYPRSMPISAARQRLLTYYFPYHRMLRQLIRETRKRFGHVILLDCHSMPSRLYVGKSEPAFDIVLGTNTVVRVLRT